jgi:hypothetical protein
MPLSSGVGVAHYRCGRRHVNSASSRKIRRNSSAHTSRWNLREVHTPPHVRGYLCDSTASYGRLRFCWRFLDADLMQVGEQNFPRVRIGRVGFRRRRQKPIAKFQSSSTLEI